MSSQLATSHERTIWRNPLVKENNIEIWLRTGNLRKRSCSGYHVQDSRSKHRTKQTHFIFKLTILLSLNLSHSHTHTLMFWSCWTVLALAVRIRIPNVSCLETSRPMIETSLHDRWPSITYSWYLEYPVMLRARQPLIQLDPTGPVSSTHLFFGADSS